MFDGIRKFYSEKRNFALFATAIGSAIIISLLIIPLSGTSVLFFALGVFGAVSLVEIAHRILYKAPLLLK